MTSPADDIATVLCVALVCATIIAYVVLTREVP